MEERRRCSRCRAIRPLSNFFKEQTTCTDCKEYNKKNRDKRLGRINEIKKGKKCMICGEPRFYCLDFHHSKNIKKSNVSAFVWNGAKTETIDKEIENCIVLCANCHRELHYLEKHPKERIDKKKIKE